MRRLLPNAFIDQLGKELAVNEARSPLGVISSSGLCGHYFIKRFALPFESGNTVANGSKEIAVFDHFGFAADRAVPRNNNGLVRHPREICFRRLDHAVNVSASRIIDEWEMSVPPSVARMQDISLGKIDRDIAIGVGGPVIFKSDGCAVKMKRLLRPGDLGWDCCRWALREGKIPVINSGCC